MIVREFVPLAPLTTFKIGGSARYFIEVNSMTAVKEAVEFAHKHKLPVTVFGGGANVLVPDEGIPGIVFYITVPGIEWRDNGAYVHVIAGAGMQWDEFVQRVVGRNLWGVENLSGIPGTVGGAVVQNLGAYGVDLSGVLEWAEIYDANTGSERRIYNRDCRFGYRDSLWKHEEGKKYYIIRACFLLKKESRPNTSYKDVEGYFLRTGRDPSSMAEMRNAIIEIRKNKFPDLSVIGTAGSFFKNPVVSEGDAERLVARFPNVPCFPLEDGKVKLSAAWIIDHVLHLRGLRKGTVGVWDAQALVLVNYGGAKANEVKAFAREIQYRAAVEAGISIEPEVVFLEN